MKTNKQELDEKSYQFNFAVSPNEALAGVAGPAYFVRSWCQKQKAWAELYLKQINESLIGMEVTPYERSRAIARKFVMSNDTPYTILDVVDHITEDGTDVALRGSCVSAAIDEVDSYKHLYRHSLTGEVTSRRV